MYGQCAASHLSLSSVSQQRYLRGVWGRSRKQTGRNAHSIALMGTPQDYELVAKKKMAQVPSHPLLSRSPESPLSCQQIPLNLLAASPPQTTD